MNERRREAKRDAALAEIARDLLGIETLETRKSDDLDFHDLAVWTIERALTVAYEAGRLAGLGDQPSPTAKESTMRITSMELAGSSRTMLRDGSAGRPRAFARIEREAGAEVIRITFLRPNQPEDVHEVLADDEGDQRCAAEMLQRELDGYAGTNREVGDYLRVIQQLAD